jgi:hypothetical protein
MSSEHSVIIHFLYGSTDLSRLFALEDELSSVVDTSGVGEVDGNEIAVDGSDGYLFLYGPDADKLFNAIKPVLESTDFMKGAKVTLQYGPPDVGGREAEFEIGA